jgi:pimeloyl-ACP methyl ester carboxylesterase
MWEARDIEFGGGRSLFAFQGGRGPDLVLVHGAVTTNHDWRVGPAEALARHFRVTIVDRPGHGRSRRPRFIGTPRDQAAQLAKGLDRLGVERPVMAGHSFGALVALALAEQQPKLLAGLVLVSPLAFPEPRFLEHLLMAPRSLPVVGPLFSGLAHAMRLDRNMLPVVQRVMFSPDPVPDHWRDSFPYDEMTEAAEMVFQGEDAASTLPISPAATVALATIETPAYILAGSADKVADPLRHAVPLSRLLPNARLFEIEGAGHMLHHTHSESVIEAIHEAAATAEA